jgi:dolichol-phosphate mannosyltransferase
MRTSVVIPVYNEADALPTVLEALLAEWDAAGLGEIEVLPVDDGSTDDTAALLAALTVRDPRVRPLTLFVNAGHQRALVAGMDAATGDLVATMDGDGQHPVPALLEMVREAHVHPEAHVIQGVRRGRQPGLLKHLSSRAYYRVARWLLPELDLVPGASDFRVLSRPAVDALALFGDRHRSLRILLAGLRLPTRYVAYDVAPRLAGRSRYGWRQMWQFAYDGIFAFSWLPLRLAKGFALLAMLVAAGFLGYALWRHAQGRTIWGWTSLVALVTFFFAGVFWVLSCLGEYIKRIYEDVRRRPVYVRLKTPPGASAPAPEPTTPKPANR